MVETVEMAGQREPDAEAPNRSWSTLLAGWIIRRRWLTAFVIAPTVVTALYLFLFAADRFESEAKFVVRSPSTATAGQLSSLVQATGIVRSSDDAYIVHAYMRSRDALRKLMSYVDLHRLLDRSGADILWRYPLPFLSPNEEHLLRHFARFVTIEYDQTTGITMLKVQAFRSEDAQTVAEALLKDAEELINRLTERSQTDAISDASREVELSRQRARTALDRITQFRESHSVVDPARLSNASLETIARLALEMSQTSAQMAEVQKSSPDGPQSNTLRFRMRALEEQIQKERELVAGADTSLAPLIADYERLVLEREFAERTFASAQARESFLGK
jgi:capsular polysaccharide transport system permease protein